MRILAINAINELYDNEYSYSLPELPRAYTGTFYSRIDNQGAPIKETREMLKSIPNVDFCQTYTEALTRLKLNRSYDLIITSFTPRHLQRYADQKNGIVDGKTEFNDLNYPFADYSSPMAYLKEIKLTNPFCKLIVYTGYNAHQYIQRYTIYNPQSILQKFTEDFIWIQKDKPRTDKIRIQSSLFELLSELEINLHQDGKFKLNYVLSRAAINSNIEENNQRIITKPHIPFWNKNDGLLEEFEFLLNDPRITEHKIHLFLEHHHEILLGQRYKTLRSKVVLARDGANPLIPDFILEPINSSDFWKIIELKLPVKKITQSPKNREGFNSAVTNAINQMTKYRDYFDNPVYRARMKDQGINAYRPMLSLIIGTNYGGLTQEQILDTKKYHTSNNVEIMTYKELYEQVTYIKQFVLKDTI